MQPVAAQSVWTQEYDVNTLVLNSQKRLGLYGLLNILGDAAWNHAEYLGCGYEAMIARGTVWVLTRQKLAMTRWPSWGDRLTVRTWPCPFAGPQAPRQFEFFVGGKKIGECVTLWLVMDYHSRRPKRFNVNETPFDVRREGLLAIEAAKLPLRDDFSAVTTLCVRNSDMDVNGHVGNTRYAQWILDALPPKALRKFKLESYEVNFLAETKRGDEIELSGGKAARGMWQFQGRRIKDGKAVFAARLGISSAPSIASCPH